LDVLHRWSPVVPSYYTSRLAHEYSCIFCHQIWTALYVDVGASTGTCHCRWYGFSRNYAVIFLTKFLPFHRPVVEVPRILSFVLPLPIQPVISLQVSINLYHRLCGLWTFHSCLQTFEGSSVLHKEECLCCFADCLRRGLRLSDSSNFLIWCRLQVRCLFAEGRPSLGLFEARI
jgi:hypothetical protein